ncbi:MAG: sulfite reductase subunit beta (hemoprotein) [Actinobacteria bacterium]|nr:sulfite reductase subunit beta (hemoprotein) [Actinomycetota bacterium]
MRFYESASTLEKEQDQFDLDMKSFAAGEINPVKFKAIRVAHGVYEQRQEHTYMIRIRCAGGGITPSQLKKVAELGAQYGSGEVHFTTRCEVQVHNVLLQNVIKVIRGLNEVGLSSRGGGGNTIRNILCPSKSGVDPDEAFDVTPYTVALTTRMIQEEDSWNLPRKFKIAFSHSEKDVAFTQTTCLGFVARVKDGQKGFAVYCAGGMGAKPMVGHQLFDFIPDDQVYHVTRAMKLMFDKHGNRRSKFSSRIKFLWKKLDREDFEARFNEDYLPIKGDKSLNLVLPEIENSANDTDLVVEPAEGPEFALWKQRFVSAQKQEGLYCIKVPLQLGDLLSKDAYQLCDFLDHFGENTIRCDRGQNMRIRNIPEKYLGNLYHVMTKLDHTLVQFPAFISNMINCTGAQTCKLGICLPRGLSTEIRERLDKTDLDLERLSGFRLNMSGCPNTCGMHHVADLGFFGKISRKSGNLYPAYNVLAGAKTGQHGQTEYAKKLGEVAAHHIPDFVADFLGNYLEEKEDHDSYQAYLDAGGNDLIKALCEQYKEVPEYEEDARFYTDFGAKKRLSLDELGSAECSAGIFDMIGVDQKSIQAIEKAFDQTTDKDNDLYKVVFHSARMLLVTRGLDAKTDEQAFQLFAKHFIQAGLIDESYLTLVNAAKQRDLSALSANESQVFELAKAVNTLYKSMDDSLRFKVEKKTPETAQKTDSDEVLEKDFRGVACPMNFVKTKLVLDTLQAGQQLQILLDDGAPIENVPNSVKLEGHQVLKQEQDGSGHWRVLIQKVNG